MREQLKAMSVAVVTMVFDDVEYLPVWLRYWRAHLPDRNLYVLVHGEQPELEAMAEGCNVVRLNRPEPYSNMEFDRWRMISHFASSLTLMFDTVVYTDVDEILVLDPDAEGDIASRLAAAAAPATAPHGVEVIHRVAAEPDDLDISKPILSQRRFCRGSARFSKPCIITEPLHWRRGGHYVYSDVVASDSQIYNFHLRYFDMNLFRDRAQRRRATTKAPRGKNLTPARRWRVEDAALEEHIAGVTGIEFHETAPFNFSYLNRAVGRGRMIESPPGHFMKYSLREDAVLRRIPDRFATVL